MSQHGDDVSVREDCCCDLADLEVYSTCATTDTAEQTDEQTWQVTVDLDEEALEEIYNQSAVSGEYTFEQFKQKVQEEADKAASEAYPKIKEVNDLWDAVASYAQRIVKVRLAIPVGWLRLYICYKP